MKTTLFIASALFALTVFRCGGEDPPDGDPVVTGETGRGTATCREWQSALCELSERCGVLSSDQCLTQAHAIECKSDERARTCADQLKEASCTNAPAGCDLRDLADPAPAIAACNTFIDAVCTADNRCGRNESVEACAAELQDRYHCERVLGVKLAYESCIESLESLECTAAAPGNCNGVFLQ